MESRQCHVRLRSRETSSKKLIFLTNGITICSRTQQKISAKMIKILIEEKFESGVDMISINIPLAATVNSDFEITKPYREKYGKLFHKKSDRYVHENPEFNYSDMVEGTDINAMKNGKNIHNPFEP